MIFWLFATLLFAVSMFFVFILKDELKKERDENNKLKIKEEIKASKDYDEPLNIRYKYNEKVITNLVNIAGKDYRIVDTEFFSEDVYAIKLNYIDIRKDNILVRPNEGKLLFLEKE